MAGQALGIVIGNLALERLVRIVAGRATYAAVIRVTLAVEDTVRLKADVVDLHRLENAKLIVASMTGGTKVLRQLVAAEAFGIVNQVRAGITLLGRRDMRASRSMTSFAAD